MWSASLRILLLGLSLSAGYAFFSSPASLHVPGVDQNPTPGGITTQPERPYVHPSAPLAGTPSFEEQVVQIVNQQRLANGGLPPLKKVLLLDNSSETHSSNMATRNFFAHCDPYTDLDPFDRMTAAGYSWSTAAENVAAGYSTPQSVMAG